MASVGGKHRQRTTGRLMGYWATYSTSSSSVEYVGVVLEGVNLLAQPEGTTSFDSSEMSADEAVRLHIGRFIDDNVLGAGTPPDPSWTDYGPYK